MLLFIQFLHSNWIEFLRNFSSFLLVATSRVAFDVRCDAKRNERRLNEILSLIKKFIFNDKWKKKNGKYILWKKWMTNERSRAEQWHEIIRRKDILTSFLSIFSLFQFSSVLRLWFSSALVYANCRNEMFVNKFFLFATVTPLIYSFAYNFAMYYYNHWWHSCAWQDLECFVVMMMLLYDLGVKAHAQTFHLTFLGGIFL